MRLSTPRQSNHDRIGPSPVPVRTRFGFGDLPEILNAAMTMVTTRPVPDEQADAFVLSGGGRVAIRQPRIHKHSRRGGRRHALLTINQEQELVVELSGCHDPRMVREVANRWVANRIGRPANSRWMQRFLGRHGFVMPLWASGRKDRL